MSKYDLDHPMITEISDVCFVTSDLDALLEEYVSAYGMGPWKLYEQSAQDRDTGERYTYRYAVCSFSNLNFKVIQPLAGRSSYSDYLERYGCGMYHLTVQTVCPLEELFAHRSAAVAKVIQTSVQPDGVVRVLTDHVEALGTCLEFVKRPEHYAGPEPSGVYPSGAAAGKYGFTVDHPMITRIIQLAFCVHDRWVTIKEWYDDYGVGPWTFHIQNQDSAKDVVNFGTPIEIDSVANVCIDLNVDLEILKTNRPVDNVYDMLKERGPALHHICVETSNSFEEAIDVMTREGHPATRTCIMDGVEKVAHTDHRGTFGCYFELVYRDKDFVPPIHEMYPAWAKPSKPTSLKKIF